MQCIKFKTDILQYAVYKWPILDTISYLISDSITTILTVTVTTIIKKIEFTFPNSSTICIRTYIYIYIAFHLYFQDTTVLLPKQSKPIKKKFYQTNTSDSLSRVVKLKFNLFLLDGSESDVGRWQVFDWHWHWHRHVRIPTGLLLNPRCFLSH